MFFTNYCQMCRPNLLLTLTFSNFSITPSVMDLPGPHDPQITANLNGNCRLLKWLLLSFLLASLPFNRLFFNKLRANTFILPLFSTLVQYKDVQCKSLLAGTSHQLRLILSFQTLYNWTLSQARRQDFTKFKFITRFN